MYEGDCQSKYREKMTNKRHGHWSTDEDAQLAELVQKAQRELKDPSAPLPWTSIAGHMERSAKKCSEHWKNCCDAGLTLTGVVSGGVALTRDEELALVQGVHESGAETEAQVPWATLLDGVARGPAESHLARLMKDARLHQGPKKCDEHATLHERAETLLELLEEDASARAQRLKQAEKTPCPARPHASSLPCPRAPGER